MNVPCFCEANYLTFYNLKQYYEICHKYALYVHFSQQILYWWHKSIELQDQTISYEYESYRSCSYDRICNYISFTGILVKLILQYCIGKAVFRIFQFYARQPIWIHQGLRIWWKPRSFHDFLMKKMKSKNFHLHVWSNLVVLL